MLNLRLVPATSHRHLLQYVLYSLPSSTTTAYLALDRSALRGSPVQTRSALSSMRDPVDRGVSERLCVFDTIFGADWILNISLISDDIVVCCPTAIYPAIPSSSQTHLFSNDDRSALSPLQPTTSPQVAF